MSDNDWLSVPEPAAGRDGLPIYPGHLMRWRRIVTLLMTDRITLPCWIECENSRIKITAEDKQGVIVGLMLAADLEEIQGDK